MVAGSDQQDLFTHWDAAYVVGALSLRERHDYERHLQHCARCAEAVRELAGLPGLLAKVHPEEVSVAGTQAPPRTLLSSLLAAAGRERRRGRRTAVAGWLVAAAAAVALVIVVAVHATETPAAPAAAPTASMTAVVQAPVHGTARLDTVPWGTRVDVRCSYDGGSRSVPYALVVLDRDGRPHAIGSWNAKPGKTYDIQGATALPRTEITAVEVRLTDGTSVLRWTP